MTSAFSPRWVLLALCALAAVGCSRDDSSGPIRTTAPAVVAPTTSLVSGYAYVADTFEDRIEVYEVRGAPSTQSLVHAGATTADFPVHVVSAPSRGFVYATTDQGVEAYAAGADGQLTHVAQLALDTEQLVVDPLERFVFALSDRGREVATYAIGADGALSLVGAAALNGSADHLVLDASGSMLVTADRWSSPLQVLHVDAAGGLTKLGELGLSGVYELLLNPDGRHVHAWTDAGVLETVALDPQTRVATWLGGGVALSLDAYDLGLVGEDLFVSRVDVLTGGALPMTRYRWNATNLTFVPLTTAATPPLDASGLLSARGELWVLGGYSMSVLRVSQGNELSALSGALAAWPSTRIPPRDTAFVWR